MSRASYHLAPLASMPTQAAHKPTQGDCAQGMGKPLLGERKPLTSHVSGFRLYRASNRSLVAAKLGFVVGAIGLPMPEHCSVAFGCLYCFAYCFARYRVLFRALFSIKRQFRRFCLSAHVRLFTCRVSGLIVAGSWIITFFASLCPLFLSIHRPSKLRFLRYLIAK